MTTARAQQASALLQNIQRSQSGRLTVFLGAAPGVGKTYAMLSRAHELLAQGMDVCIAVVESHGRADTEKLIAGIPSIPVKMLMHQGRELAEMDIDAVLQRKPAVVLVDELAHRNIPNSRHERRWQDVNELLDAGIDVMTTMNVQHLESLNDVVLQITGVRVSETVPDRVFDRIRDIRLIDLPVSELIERLKQGKVYQSEHADMALQHFFSVDNLTALRELAVQCVAEQVDDDLRQRYAARGQLGVALKPQLLLAIDGNAQAEALVRQACRVAERLNAEWTVVYVQNQPHQHLSRNDAANAATLESTDSREPFNSQPANHATTTTSTSTSISTTSTPKAKLNKTQKAVDSAFQLARQLGARTEMLYGQDVAQVLLDVVSDRAITTLMLGQSDRSKWQQYLRPSFATRVLLHAPQVDVHIVPRQNPKQNLKQSKSQSTQQTATDFSAWLLSWQDMLVAFVVSTLATGVSALGERVLDIQDLSVIYIVAVLLVAAKSHWRRAVLTAVLCFVAYNFFFIEPRYTLQISAHQGVVTVLAFLASALIASRLASQLRLQVLSLQAANRYTQTMQDLARELASAPDLKQVMLVGQQCLQQRFAAQVWLKVGDEIVQHPSIELNDKEKIAYAWCLQHQQACGRYTDTLSQIRYWFIPLQSKSQCVGVMGITFEKATSTLPFALKQHIEAIVEYIAQAVERTLLVQQLEQAKVSTETEKLRSALLSSVSHDLRSPLAAMMGSADTLLHYHAALAASDRTELLDSIRQEGQRLDRYIQNLLDMTRLGHNGLSLKREWIAAQDLVASATQRLQRYLPELKLSLNMPEQAILIYVHPALIEQALFNVLENAAHFSPAHEAVTLQMQKIEDNRLQFRIEDRGVGIPEAEREQIFDMFYTMQRGDRGQSGTGLGLTIVKAIVAAHMGEIRASAGSQQQGTMITINLPIHPAGTQNE